MKITFYLDDDVYEQIKAQSGDKSAEGVRKAIKDRVKQFAYVPPTERHILVVGKDRQDLEGVFQTTVDSTQDLIRKVKSLCSFKLGSVERSFTAGELARLHEQASFHGWSPEQWLEMTSNEAMDYVFNRM